MGDKLSSIEQATLGRRLARNADRIKRLEQFLTGVPLGTVHFANAIITNAQIDNLSADRIRSGQIAVGTEIDINDGQIVISDEYIKVAKAGFKAKTAAPKDMILDSDIPCLKFIQVGQRSVSLSNGASTTYEENITTSFPIIPLIYLYVPSVSAYKMATREVWPNYFSDFLHISYEFSTTKLYVTVSNFTGSSVNTHYYWFIGFA